MGPILAFLIATIAVFSKVLFEIFVFVLLLAGISKTDAQQVVMELQAKGQYKEDVWTIQDDVVRMYSKAMAEDKKRQVMNAIVPPERRLVVCDMV